MGSKISEFLNFIKSDEGELGSAGEQPNRNSQTDWNGQGGELAFSPYFQGHSCHWIPSKTHHI